MNNEIGNVAGGYIDPTFGIIPSRVHADLERERVRKNDQTVGIRDHPSGVRHLISIIMPEPVDGRACHRLAIYANNTDGVRIGNDWCATTDKKNGDDR